MAKPQPAPAPDRMLRARAVAERVGVCRPTLYRWVRKGQFPPPLQLGANTVAWPESAVEAWLAARPKASWAPDDSRGQSSAA